VATIYEVALAAGVSPATVSRVFNGGRVTPERAERVRKAAESLGFTPNGVARSLRLQRSNVVGLIIPDIENPFFTSLARGVEDAAQQTNLSVVLCNSDENIDKERKYLGIALTENMAGVIVAPASVRHTDFSMLLSRGVPVVTVDRHPRGTDAVTVDNRHGGQEATWHLIERGYRRIACITGPDGVWTSDERLGGFLSAIRDHLREQSEPGLGLDEYRRRYVRYADFRVEGGRAAMAELLTAPEPPDAVFIANNLMTVGALQALQAAGVAPPAIGVVSFGEVPWASLVHQSLTTVDLPARDLGRASAELLQQRIAGDGGPLRTTVLHTSLQIRDSTAGPAVPAG
jgi:LacI family transcriptional regulator